MCRNALMNYIMVIVIFQTEYVNKYIRFLYMIQAAVFFYNLYNYTRFFLSIYYLEQPMCQVLLIFITNRNFFRILITE